MARSGKVTAEEILAAPRRGALQPNASGKLALSTLSTHKFGDKTLKEVRVVDIETGSSKQVSDHEKAQDATWIPGGDDDVVYLRSGEKGRTEVLVASGADVSKEHYVVADIDAPIGDLKLESLDEGTVAFVVTGVVGDDGKLYNEEAVENKSTGRIFDSGRIHFWDTICSAHRLSIWYTTMKREDGKWKLQGPLINAIRDNTLALNGQDDGSGDIPSNFDISSKGVAFLARDLTKKKVYETLMTNAYYVAIQDFTSPPTGDIRPLPTPQGVGAGYDSNIRFSPDASQVAYLHTVSGGFNEARLYTTSTESAGDTVDAFKQAGVDYTGYDPIDSFEFAGTSDSIIFISPRKGRHVLSKLSLQKDQKPQDLFVGGGIKDWKPLQDNRWDKLVVSSSTYIEDSLWQVIDGEKGGVSRVISSASDNGAKFGFSPNMVTEIWYKGADDLDIQSWVIRPSDFDEKKKYPWVLFPHGGPVSAHTDAWSTRWNLAAWAEQGYVVFAPNVTGSPGFGLDFVNRINGHWGGRPYEDLLKLIQHAETLSYLDQDKAVLAGASYGGYMVEWFMGHDIIKKFCCAVCHDGVYSIPVSSMQDDCAWEDGSKPGPLYPWEEPEEMEKWNPARPELLRNWKHAPPTLVIHSAKDYRCNVADGIAMVKALHAQEVPTRYLHFADEGHWVLKPENSLVWHKTVWGWMEKCVNGEIKRGDKKW